MKLLRLDLWPGMSWSKTNARHAATSGSASQRRNMALMSVTRGWLGWSWCAPAPSPTRRWAHFKEGM